MNNETFLACLKAADTLNQCVSRMSLLSTLSANSILRSSMERSVLSLRSGSQALCDEFTQQSPSKSVEAAVNLVQEANEKALFDWRNQVQSAMLMQDEATIWAQRIGERLEAIRHAAMLKPAQGSCLAGLIATPIGRLRRE